MRTADEVSHAEVGSCHPVGFRTVCVPHGAGGRCPPPTPVPLDYMANLRNAEAEAAEVERSTDKSLVRAALSTLATQQSFVGDTERAIETFYRAGYRSGAKTLTEDEARQFIDDHEVRDALETIVELARGRQIVIINEAHHVPRDRAFATLVALELRKLGFKYFAMEALFADPNVLAARGYSIAAGAEGHYNREPVFGDYIRRALAVGYTPVAYEAKDFPPAGSRSTCRLP